ncbi:signal peptidase I [Nisaea acidiphila]|uniref:Signal peptidase I n=1 Tax=Nisaea acidiphila TaxID=1862145 RepID=A0A9J7AYL7_9PROT|nr:signal peptidase I [Nisaea acidiphila]UUX51529.1 signal peptidase I [Nisaea acidiphila]
MQGSGKGLFGEDLLMARDSGFLKSSIKWGAIAAGILAMALIALFVFHVAKTGISSMAWVISGGKNYHAFTPAMEPNFNPGEHMMARLENFSGTFPRRGSVLVVRHPLNPEQDWVRRLVGLPFDRIEIVDGVLHVNGSPVALSQVDAKDDARRLMRETLPGGHSHLILVSKDGGAGANFDEITVPSGHIFLLADNRDRAKDSRHAELGLVPLDNIIGIAEFIYLSTDLSRLGAAIE